MNLDWTYQLKTKSSSLSSWDPANITPIVLSNWYVRLHKILSIHFSNSLFWQMRKFYLFKAKHPKWSANLYPTPLRHVFDKEVFQFLPTRSSTGSRIMIVNVGSKYNFFYFSFSSQRLRMKVFIWTALICQMFWVPNSQLIKWLFIRN